MGYAAAVEVRAMLAPRVAPPALGCCSLFVLPALTDRPNLCRPSGTGAAISDARDLGADFFRCECPGCCNWRASCCNWIQGKGVKCRKNCRLEIGSGDCFVGVAAISNRARFCRLERGGFVTCVAWVVCGRVL